jgi:4'-phosphopantetheinyl transferase
MTMGRAQGSSAAPEAGFFRRDTCGLSGFGEELALPISGQVQVWRRELSPDAGDLRALHEILSADEKARSSRFLLEKPRHEYIATRGTLRRLLASHLSCDPRDVAFAYAPSGKPCLDGQFRSSGICFNVSHTDGLAVIALSWKGEIGVDVERLRSDRDPRNIARRFFSQREQDQLLGLSGSELHEAFFRCWTRKEAYIKACGEGLALPLDSFDVEFAAGKPPALLATRPDPSIVDHWQLYDLPVGPGYAAALALASQKPVAKAPPQQHHCAAAGAPEEN